MSAARGGGGARRRRPPAARVDASRSMPARSSIPLCSWHISPLPNPSITHTHTELTGRVQRAEAEATYPAEEGAHEAAVAAAAGASREAQENVNALNSQLQALQQQRQGIRSQVAALQRKAEHIEQLVVDAEPRTR